MANKYYFKTTGGDSFIPIADGTHYTELMSEDYGDGEVYVALYNSAKTQITGTAGTVTFSGTPDDIQYLAASAATTVDATKLKVVGTDSTYTPPVFSGSVVRGRMVLASLAGTDAAYVRAWHVRR